MTKIEITNKTIEAAMNKAIVKRKLKEVADSIAKKANAIGSSEGVDMDAKVTEIVRPKGRPEARVSSKQVNQEFGTAKTPRRRILARAAAGVGGVVGVETGGATQTRGGVRS